MRARAVLAPHRLALVCLALVACRGAPVPQDPQDMLFPDERTGRPRAAAADAVDEDRGPVRANVHVGLGVTSLDYVTVPDDDFVGGFAGLDFDLGVAPWSGPVEFGVRLGGRAFGVEDSSLRGVPTEITGVTGIAAGYLRVEYEPDWSDFGMFAEGYGGIHGSELTVTARTSFADVVGEANDRGAIYGAAVGARWRSDDGPATRVALFWERAEFDELVIDQDSFGVRLGFEIGF